MTAYKLNITFRIFLKLNVCTWYAGTEHTFLCRNKIVHILCGAVWFISKVRCMICISWLNKKKKHVFLVCLNVFIAVLSIQASLVLLLNLCLEGLVDDRTCQKGLFLCGSRDWIKMKCFTSEVKVLYLKKKNQM